MKISSQNKAMNICYTVTHTYDITSIFPLPHSCLLCKSQISVIVSRTPNLTGEGGVGNGGWLVMVQAQKHVFYMLKADFLSRSITCPSFM